MKAATTRKRFMDMMVTDRDGTKTFDIAVEMLAENFVKKKFLSALAKDASYAIFSRSTPSER
jgi:hypothetical protein